MATATTPKTWDRSAASPQELTDHAEGRADAKSNYPPQPPSGRADTAYMAGYRGTRSTSSSSRSSSSSGSKSSSSSRRSSGSAKSRKPTARRSRAAGPARRGARRAARAAGRPIEQSVFNGLTLLAMAAGVAFLYRLLVDAPTTASALDKVTGVVKWLDSTASIPYRT